MVKVIIVYLIIIGISILVGLNIRIENAKSGLHGGTDIKDVSHDRECKSGICPPIEENKNE